MTEPNTRLAVVTLRDIHCSCGGTYAIAERFFEDCRQLGTSWMCPYCRNGWGFTDDGENAKLKREVASEKKRKEWAEQSAEQNMQRAISAENRERAQKAAKTRLKNRIKNGVCPCCTRSFENLQRHIKTKHPGFAQEIPFTGAVT